MHSHQSSQWSVSGSTPKVTIQDDETTTASRDTVSEVEEKPNINKIDHDTTPTKSTEVEASKSIQVTQPVFQ